MNKLIMLLLIVLLSTTASFGQSNKFEIALEGGPSLISLRGNDVLKTYSQPKIGFSGGAALQYSISERLSFRTGFSFERKGGKTEVHAATNTGSVDYVSHFRYDCLTLPLMGRVSFGDRYRLFANAGPYISYLLSQTTVVEATSEHPEDRLDNTAETNRFDSGISMGIGAAIPMSSNLLLSLEVRNNLGLFNVSRGPVVNDGTIKTNSTNLLLGVSFKL